MNITFLDNKKFFLSAGLLLLFLIIGTGNVSATNPDNNTIDSLTVEDSNLNNSDLVINTTDNSDVVSVNFKKGDITQNGKIVNEMYPSIINDFRRNIGNKSISDVMKNVLDENCKEENLEKGYKHELKLLSDKILLNLYNLDYVINESLTLSEKDLYNKIKLFNSLKYGNNYYSLSELYNNCSDSNKNLNKSVVRINVLINNCLKSIEKYIQNINSHNKNLKEYLPTSFKHYEDKLSYVKKHYPNSDLKELVNITENTIKSLNSRIIYLNTLSKHLNDLKTDLERTKNIIKAKYKIE